VTVSTLVMPVAVPTSMNLLAPWVPSMVRELMVRAAGST